MQYLGNGIGHQATNHIHFDDTVCSNSSAELAQPGEVDENSDVESDSDAGELNLNDLEFLDDDNDGVLEEMISNGDDDYGYNHNRLMHEDEEWDIDGIGENDEGSEGESMYL